MGNFASDLESLPVKTTTSGQSQWFYMDVHEVTTPNLRNSLLPPDMLLSLNAKSRRRWFAPGSLVFESPSDVLA